MVLEKAFCAMVDSQGVVYSVLQFFCLCRFLTPYCLQASYRPCLELEIKVLRGRDITVGYSDYCEYDMKCEY